MAKLSVCCITLNGNLTKQVFCQNQILISKEEKKKSRLKASQRNSSSLAKELEVVAPKTARFNKWWDSKWPLDLQEVMAAPRRWTLISIKNFKSNKLLRHSRSFNLKRLQVLQAKLPLPGWTRPPLEQEVPQAQTIQPKIKKLIMELKQAVVQTGEPASSMTTMTTNSITLSSRMPSAETERTQTSWQIRFKSKRRSWASMLPADKEKRTRAEAMLLCLRLSLVTQRVEDQSWARMNLLWETCDLNWNTQIKYI